MPAFQEKSADFSSKVSYIFVRNQLTFCCHMRMGLGLGEIQASTR